MNLPIPQVESLIFRHLTGELTGDEQQQLAAALKASEEARELLASHLQLEACVLRLARGKEISAHGDTPTEVDEFAEVGAAVGPVTAPGTIVTTTRRERLRPLTRLLATGIALAVVALIGYVGIVLTPSGDSRAPSDLADLENASGADLPAAYLTRAVGAIWNGPPLDVGSRLTVQTLSLEDGVAEIQFSCGATVILEGPAELQIVSSDEGLLRCGRLHSIVPPEAFGFSIASKSQTVVDLGTEFGFEVNESGAAEVHVFDGEVEVYDGAKQEGDPRLVSAGEALRFEPTGESSFLLADSSFFVGTSSLELRSVAFTVDLDERLDALRRRQRELRGQERDHVAAIRQSRKLKSLRARVEVARKALLKASLNDRPVKEAEFAKRESRKQLESIIDRKLVESSVGREVAAKRNELERNINRLRQQLSDLGNSDRAAKKRLAKKMQRVVRERSKQHQILRQYRQKIRKSDEDVKLAIEDFSEKRRRVHGVLSQTSAPKLHKKWKLAKKELSYELKRVLNNDKRLKEIREKKRRLNDEMKLLRRNLRDKQSDSGEIAKSDSAPSARYDA